MGWNGTGWDGMGRDGMGWDGMVGVGWDVMGWDGMDAVCGEANHQHLFTSYKLLATGRFTHPRATINVYFLVARFSTRFENPDAG